MWPARTVLAWVMAAENQITASERDNTDESLRVEREKVDAELAEVAALADDVADRVINLARERADAVLARARARADGEADYTSPGPAIEGARQREDRSISDERDRADALVQRERTAGAATLASERDATDQDLLVERERADTALATRDDFLGIVSHDLRNMLAVFAGTSELIASDVLHVDHVARVTAHTQRIQRSITRMSRLVGDLVDLVSLDSGKLAVKTEPGDLMLVLNEAVDAFQASAAAGGVTLVVEPGPVARASFDPARILQVLTNLLSNGLKFTPRGGRVTAHIERVDALFVVSVSDTGRGIPSDKLEAVFERFLQVDKTDRRGVGLGLYISRSIVEAHGGRIWAEQRAGGGSRFAFTLPSAMT